MIFLLDIIHKTKKSGIQTWIQGWKSLIYPDLDISRKIQSGSRSSIFKNGSTNSKLHDPLANLLALKCGTYIQNSFQISYFQGLWICLNIGLWNPAKDPEVKISTVDQELWSKSNQKIEDMLGLCYFFALGLKL